MRDAPGLRRPVGVFARARCKCSSRRCLGPGHRQGDDLGYRHPWDATPTDLVGFGRAAAIASTFSETGIGGVQRRSLCKMVAEGKLERSR